MDKRAYRDGGDVGKRKERPDGIVLYQQSLQTLALLPDSAAGAAVKAAVAYFMTGETPDEAPTMEYLAFSILKVDIDAALTRFSTKCEQNRKNRNGGDQSSPVVTDGDQNRNEQNLSELNLSESEQSRVEQNKGAAVPPTAPARDENGLVFISDKDYQELDAELGGAELQRVVSYLSSYCRSSGRKYDDWPFVIRRASKEGWGLSSKPSGGSTTPGSFQPTQERIQQHNSWIDDFLAEQAKNEQRKGI